MLEQQIQEDIKAAMKAKDTVALAATRAIKGEILLFKTSEGGSKEVTDGDILKMIQKLIKQRKESAEQYTAAGRQELADNELAEAAVMEKYLPKQLSAEEVKAKVREIIAQVGATSIKDMGKVMGAANKALAGHGQGDGRCKQGPCRAVGWPDHLSGRQGAAVVGDIIRRVEIVKGCGSS